jgi:hypothetical protein
MLLRKEDNNSSSQNSGITIPMVLMRRSGKLLPLSGMRVRGGSLEELKGRGEMGMRGGMRKVRGEVW